MALHPAGDGSRDHPLLLHLAALLPPAGFAVLRYDRRPALLVAAREPRPLALVAAPGVSPAEQMRYGTDEQLRRAGHGPAARAALQELRATWEAYQRGELDRATAQRAVDAAAGEPWFSLAWVPRALPEPGAWRDMDFDPAPLIARLRAPVLLVYGADDGWTPVDASVAAFARAAPEVVRLPGTGHEPSPRDPRYDAALLGWLSCALADLA